MRRRGALLAIVAALPGCSRGLPPAPASMPSASQPAPPPSQPTTAPASPEFSPESKSWTREQALERLNDERTAPAAALRLNALAETPLFEHPAPMTVETARKLRVARLYDNLWALGWTDEAPGLLRAPVLIDGLGEVSSPLDGAELEVAVLHPAADPDVFPHLILTPMRVLLIGTEEVIAAIVAAELGGARFVLREQEGYPYLAIELAPAPATESAPSAPREVARIKWDPFEEVFMGPAADKLPDPPGGRFEIDLEESLRFIPIGGEVPEPRENTPPPKPDSQPVEPW